MGFWSSVKSAGSSAAHGTTDFVKDPLGTTVDVVDTAVSDLDKGIDSTTKDLDQAVGTAASQLDKNVDVGTKQLDQFADTATKDLDNSEISAAVTKALDDIDKESKRHEGIEVTFVRGSTADNGDINWDQQQNNGEYDPYKQDRDTQLGGESVTGPVATVMVVAGTLVVAGLVIDGNSLEDSFNLVLDVESGEYANDIEELNSKKTELEAAQKELEDYLDTLDDSFLGEIFTLSNNRKAKKAVVEYTTSEDLFNEIVDEFSVKYHLLNQGFLKKTFVGKVFSSMIMVIGGIAHEVDNITEGGRAAGRSVVNIAGYISAIVSIAAASVYCQPCAVIMAVALIASLDSTYGENRLIGATFAVIDVVLTEVVELDKYWGDEWDRFDSDSKYYEETITISQTVIMIAGMIAGGVAAWKEAAAKQLAKEAGKEAIKETTSQTAMTLGKYSKYYSYAVQAMSVNDIVEEYNNLDKLEKGLREDQDKLLKRNRDAARSKMMNSYRETESMLTDEDVAILNYEYMLYNDPTAVIDPELLIRGNPSTNRSSGNSGATSFGFEELFDYEAMNGGSNYTNSMLFG